MDRIRLAFIGLGGMGQCAHLRNFVIHPDCEVVAAADLRQDMGRVVAARYGIPRLYRDHQELLAAEQQIDGIVAIQQYQTHGRLIPELLEKHVPILIEKPIAGSLQAAQAIVAAQRRTGTPLFIGYHKRSDPATMYARRVIDEWKQSGDFGAMRYVRIAMPPGDWQAAGFAGLIRGSDPSPPVELDAAPPDMDEKTYRRYDAFANYYIHQINLMRHLIGGNYQVRYADPSGLLMVVGSESGVAGTLEMATYRTTVDWQEAAFIAFEKGWIRLELPPPLAIDRAGRVTIYEDSGNGREPRSIVPTLPHIHAMRQQATFFLQEIRGERTVLCRPDEALADLQTARDYINLLSA